MNNSNLHLGRLGHSLNPLKRARTPVIHDDTSVAGESTAEKELNPVQERRQKQFRDLYARSERMLGRLIDGSLPSVKEVPDTSAVSDGRVLTPSPARPKSTPQSKKRVAREITEDDYDDEEDTEDGSIQVEASPLRVSKPPTSAPPQHTSFGGDASSRLPPTSLVRSVSKESTASPEETRKRLEAEKQASEAAAKESFLNVIHTVENDREAMLEQQKLDELDRQVETETSAATGTQSSKSQAQSSPNNSSLGRAQLLLPNLTKRLDLNRHKVPASDAQLRDLLSNTRIGAGKWANPDKVGQEELYESLDQVLNNLKSQIQHSGPFLQAVKKKDYPDYHRIISRPMDIGTMLKRLGAKLYRSKKEFMDDLDQIWANCLKYNADPAHPLRKKAEHMKREAAKLTPLIPDITIRDRAEIEAEEREERRRQYEDSDDDDAPIAATRGRKAPNKGAKGVTAARKAPPTASEDSPVPEVKPLASSSNAMPVLRADLDSIADDSQNGIATPPIGNHTPLGPGALLDGPGVANNADISEMESVNANDAAGLDQIEDPAEEDEEYKVWKQVTMKDRARMAAERNRLFHQNRLNAEEPALLRKRSGMNRWLRQQRMILGAEATNDLVVLKDDETNVEPAPAQSLAQGMEEEEDNALPDYYFPLSGVPTVSKRLRWVEDANGIVQDQRDDSLRLLPLNYYSSLCTGKEEGTDRERQSERHSLAFKVGANLAQMQEIRKIMTKISMVKQMQVQTQTYQNQFQRYEPNRFQEADINPMPVSDDGPYIQSTVCHAALQRSISKIFYQAGFEDFQPSALDAVTDVASDYIQRLTTSLLAYHQHPKVNLAVPESFIDSTATANTAASPITIINEWQPRFSSEEVILHAMQRNGYDLETLVSYVEDEIPRLSQKLAAQHEATKQHYADLLRPAMDPAVAARDGGAAAFNDGSEQFVGGDFAEDLDEDFFGFKSLGLDIEFKAVPLHLLQSRFNNIFQPAAGAGTGTGEEEIMTDPPRWTAITSETIEDEIGIVQEFFKEKLKKTSGAALTEDEDLPAKQRFPKPRLPPTGKISSPRKRPIREQQQLARKKRRLEIEAERERDRVEQEGPNGAPPGPPGPNDDGSGGGTIAVANSSAPDMNNLMMSGGITIEASGTATADGGTETNSEEPSRRESLVQTTTNGTSNLTNGVLTNGDINLERPEPETPTLPKHIRMEKPKEDQPPDPEPEKRSSMPIAAH